MASSRSAMVGCSAVLLLALLVVSTAVEALVYNGATLAGVPLVLGNAGGLPGTSTFRNPVALCASPVNPDELVLGDDRRFRNISRVTQRTGTWFGTTVGDEEDGPLATAGVETPTACLTVELSGGRGSVMYFVEMSSVVRWVADGEVFSLLVQNGQFFMDLSVHQQSVYLLSTTRAVYRCALAAATGVPSGCAPLLLNETLAGPGPLTSAGISVTQAGMFIATGIGLYWFDLTGQRIHYLSTIPMVDVSYARKVDTEFQLYAASDRAFYVIEPNTTDNRLRAHRFLGDETAGGCGSVADWQNGDRPTFCNNARLHVVYQDEFYVTVPTMMILRSVHVFPQSVNLTFPPPPFPVGFVDEGRIMTELYGLMEDDLRRVLSSRQVSFRRAEGAVDPETWITTFAIDVPQRSYNSSTQTIVQNEPYSTTLSRLSSYYNETNELLLLDQNLLPLCNRTAMTLIQRLLISFVRDVLNYSLVYHLPIQRSPSATNTSYNTTWVKLLLPAPFGNIPPATSNTTTRELLDNSSFPEQLVQFVRDVYPTNRQQKLLFPGNVFDFSRLSPALLEEAKWRVYNMVVARLAWCAAASGDTNTSLSVTSNDLVANCTPRVGITNRSHYPLVGETFEQNEFEVFVPQAFNYSFTIENCLGGMVWTPLEDWINNVTYVPRRRRCNTGCVIGVAVGAGVLAAILLIVLVVCCSKRRRLATVLAPMEGKDHFEHTLDTVEEEEEGGSVPHPLRR